ncbi:RNA polymerase sigma factor [Ruania alkalisoli]|uniref:RNA polymerase sigma factor n=1 Tax=Ruania alkalisoli TaxID=2779775 RepID=A0A7M1SUA4_9MICO|nr:RNA polymerase sigma factor [Ruania alkalisoli]QOR70627.1 RNA polymerase sigma factor [Ruania alkalisoli]
MRPFEQVVAEHGATVLRVCRAVAGPDHADDAWSETFLAAMRAYPDLPAETNVQAWLVTIARRKSIDTHRARSRTHPTDQVPERPSTHGQPGGWERDLWEAIGDLPAKQQSAVVYHHVAGLPHAEVAALLGGTPAAARRAAADGIARLRRTYLEEVR